MGVYSRSSAEPASWELVEELFDPDKDYIGELTNEKESKGRRGLSVAGAAAGPVLDLRSAHPDLER